MQSAAKTSAFHFQNPSIPEKLTFSGIAERKILEFQRRLFDDPADIKKFCPQGWVIRINPAEDSGSGGG